jgi:hypothetical protein
MITTIAAARYGEDSARAYAGLMVIGRPSATTIDLEL